MALTSEQKKIAREIIRRGKKRGVSPMELESAIETGLVETNLRNLSYGDRDSQGWRQERKQFYKDPTNLGASIERYFNETAAARKTRKFKNSGELAQAVQRSAFPDRYEQRDGDAERILRELGGSSSGGGSSRGNPSTESTTTTTTTPGVDNSAVRRQMLQQYVLNRDRPDALLGLAQGLRGAQDVPGSTSSETVRKTTQRRRSPSGGQPSLVSGGQRPSNQLLELFYDPLGGVKRGQKIGAVGGHSDHVHVASGPKQLKALKKLAQDMGLTITSEDEGNPGDGVHTPTSYHYKGKALDIGGSPELMAKFTKRVAKKYGVRL